MIDRLLECKDFGTGVDGIPFNTEEQQKFFCMVHLRMSWANVRPVLQKHGGQLLLAARAFQFYGFEPWWYEFQICHTAPDVLAVMLDFLKKQRMEKDASSDEMG